MKAMGSHNTWSMHSSCAAGSASEQKNVSAGCRVPPFNPGVTETRSLPTKPSTMTTRPSLYVPEDGLHQLISNAIGKLLTEHIESPTKLMREIGHQARLCEILNQALVPRSVQARLFQGPKFAPIAGETESTYEVQRVQMELKIGGQQRSDIVLLRSDGPIQITRYAQGHNDVVAAIRSEDVDAVIELKACCSADKAMRHGCRLDIQKLGELPAANAIRRYFVFIDKSLPMEGMPALVLGRRAAPRDVKSDWHVEASCAHTGPQAVAVGAPATPAIELISSPEGPAVCVWDLAKTPSGIGIRGPRWMRLTS